jgi:hypothetical protein
MTTSVPAHPSPWGERLPEKKDRLRSSLARLARVDDGKLMRSIFFVMLAGCVLAVGNDYYQLQQAAENQPVFLPEQMEPAILPPVTGPSGPDTRPAPGITADPANLRKPLSVELGKGGVLEVSGTIQPGSSGTFAERIAEVGEYVKTVNLNSPGGSVSDALAMARLIREKGYATRVSGGNLCASSCPLVFSGGKERIADKGAAIGVHQVSLLGTADPLGAGQAASSAQAATAEVTRHLTVMGVDPAMWLHALETPPQQLYYFDEAELLQYRLATKAG